MAVGAPDAAVAVAVREGGGVPVVDDGVHGHGVDLDLATLRSARVGASSLTDGHRERTNEDEGESENNGHGGEGAEITANQRLCPLLHTVFL